MKEWKLTGKALECLKTYEAKVLAIKEEIEQLEDALYEAEAASFAEANRSIGVKQPISLIINVEDVNCYVIEEFDPSVCPDCGKKHEEISNVLH